MAYDWEKIFETKNNNELYEIYSGNSIFPNDTAEYARQELERRNFDFNDIEDNKSAWLLFELLIEAERVQQILKKNQEKIITYKSLYFLIPGILIIYIVLLKVLNINLTIFFPLLMIGMTLWYVSFTHRIYSKQKKEQDKRLERINKLKENIEQNFPIDKLNSVKKDITRNIEENNKRKKILNYIVIVIVLISVIVMIIEMIV